MPSCLHQDGPGLSRLACRRSGCRRCLSHHAAARTLPERAVEGVQQLGYHALWFENADLTRLDDLINHDWPVIVFLRARDLPGGGSGLHGVVVVGVTEDGTAVIDPQAGKRYTIDQKQFLIACRALGAQGMVIWK